jgi:hypothetical protein
MSNSVEVPKQWLEGLVKKAEAVKIYAPLAVIQGGFRVEGLEELKGYISSAEYMLGEQTQAGGEQHE